MSPIEVESNLYYRAKNLIPKYFPVNDFPERVTRKYRFTLVIIMGYQNSAPSEGLQFCVENLLHACKKEIPTPQIHTSLFPEIFLFIKNPQDAIPNPSLLI